MTAVWAIFVVAAVVWVVVVFADGVWAVAEVAAGAQAVVVVAAGAVAASDNQLSLQLGEGSGDDHRLGVCDDDVVVVLSDLPLGLPFDVSKGGGWPVTHQLTNVLL